MRRLYYTPFTTEADNFFCEKLDTVTTGSKGRILHITPTLILYKKRMQAYHQYLKRRNCLQSDQRDIELEQRVTLGEFKNWIRQYIYEDRQKNPLSRSECRILVQRAIRRIFPERREWLYLADEILDLFFDLNSALVSLDSYENLSSHPDWPQLISIYREYLNQLAGRMDLPTAILEAIREDPFSEYDEVVFDGPFLFFSSLHEALMERFKELNKVVTFVVPYDRNGNESNPAYRIIERVYGAYVPLKEWERLGNTPYIGSSYLERLPRSLFTDQGTRADQSIRINKHDTTEQEIMYVLKEVKDLVRHKGVNIKKVAIVTPHAMELRPLVQEMAEQAGLMTEKDERSLQHLSHTEFIQMIYQSRVDDRRLEEETYFDVSMFKKVLVTPWFSGRHTVQSFEKVKSFFEECSTVEKWVKRVKDLIKIKNDLEGMPHEMRYHPIHAVSSEDLFTWKVILDQIVRYQQRVFAHGVKTIEEHGEILFQVIQELKRNVNRHELWDDWLERLEEAVNRMSAHHRLPVSAEEFAQSIFSLLAEGMAAEERKEDENKKPRLRVTGPENIPFQEYHYIYLTRFTQDRWPDLELNRWPWNGGLSARFLSLTTRLKIGSEKELYRLFADRARYYFYLTFLSAKNAVRISFSSMEKGQPLIYSHYLYDLARTVGVEASQDKTLIKCLEDAGMLQYHHEHIKGKAVVIEEGKSDEIRLPKQMILEDLVLYRLCPKRFEYSIRFSRENVYASSFQLGFYLASLLYKRAARKLVEEYDGISISNHTDQKSQNQSLMSQVSRWIQEAEKELKFIFPVSEQIWAQGRYYGGLYLTNLLTHVFTPPGKTKSVKITFSKEIKKKERVVESSTGTYTVRGKRELRIFKNQQPFTYSLDHLGAFLKMPDQVGGFHFRDWFLALKRDFFYGEGQGGKDRLATVLNSIGQGEFKKQAGKHCIFCPFYEKCNENMVQNEDRQGLYKEAVRVDDPGTTTGDPEQ
ncbi:hypothetical protein ACFQ40_02110 [Kroppenstedtia eburnea]|uniref:hypothetical protein n=1 Tax=Kroppenstedtia eburnea TaxID=714067 RepID=UPI003634E8FC